MQYLGGKHRAAPAIAATINRVRAPGQWVWDAFCGGLSVTKALLPHGPVQATDANYALICMYQALANGWDPPSTLTPDEYRAARELPDTDPLKAYAGFACSFGAKWFGGYAGRARQSYARPIEGAQKKVRLDRQACVRARPACVDFLSIDPQPTHAVLYLDPPYAGTTGYAGVAAFDHARFVDRVAAWSVHADVFVSEYAFPLGVCVLDSPQQTTVSAGTTGKGRAAVERLFYIARGSL